MGSVFDIYIRDEDSKRDVYLGSQRDEPPRIIELANPAVNFDGAVASLRRARYRRLSIEGSKHTYVQE